MAIGEDLKKSHYELTNVGLRAQATAAGLVQLCKELRVAGVLGEEAIDRIKAAVANEIAICAPRTANLARVRKDAQERLDRIFAGDEELGDGRDQFAESL